MENKILYPMISYSRNDDGTFREVVDGFDASLPVQMYRLTQQELDDLLQLREIANEYTREQLRKSLHPLGEFFTPVNSYGSKVSTLELEVSRLRAALLVLMAYTSGDPKLHERIESILQVKHEQEAK